VAETSHLLLRAVGRATNDKNEGQCVIQPFGKDISTASFAMYTFSIAVLVQAVVLISFSSVADHGKLFLRDLQTAADLFQERIAKSSC
jgi:UMF1 family MFS transporter